MGKRIYEKDTRTAPSPPPGTPRPDPPGTRRVKDDKMIKHEKELIHHDELMKYYGQIVDPLRDHDRALLREKATLLKQIDGESWACGEAICRIINLLSMCELFTSQSSNQKAIKNV